MRTFLTTLAMLFLFAGAVQAQTVITGKVTDGKNGLPLAGVSVRQKSSSTGVQTDNDGNFRISITDKDKILVLTYVGYAAEEVAVGNKSNITVALSTEDKKLQEVVVVAYGTANKKTVTGSV